MRQTFRVRYYECDMQKVVHNAVYLAWCDDLGDRMFRAAGLPAEAGWDVMVKAASITWSSSARIDDEIVVEAAVSRWGTTSFEMAEERPIEVPPAFRTALGPA
jgi:acyl-CoA thioester hydrolase